MRVLFLDFDGVLHAVTGPSSTTKEFVWAPILDLLISEYLDVKLVVHASARDHMTVEWMAARIGKLGERIIGAAPARFQRWEAIQRFLASSPQVSSYRILDDMPKEFPRGLKELIVCQSNLGISDPAVQRRLKVWLARDRRAQF